jgi:hypothetical protein
MKTDIHFVSQFLEWEMFQTKFVEKIKTDISCSITTPPGKKMCRLLGNLEKYCRARQATDDNMVHVH